MHLRAVTHPSLRARSRLGTWEPVALQLLRQPIEVVVPFPFELVVHQEPSVRGASTAVIARVRASHVRRSLVS